MRGEMMPGSMENERRPTTWCDLHDHLFEDTWDEGIGRYRSRFAYRGISDAAYTLKTTLIRLGGDYVQLEHHLLRNFRKYAERTIVKRDSVWEWLSVAQHYGLPTRLMDWTYSPLIALHFATANIDNMDKDGVIWAVNYVKAHCLLPVVLRTELENEGANVFTVEMLTNAVNTLKRLANLSESSVVLFFEPPSMDDRIVNQYALFSVTSDPTMLLDVWASENPHLYRKITIPSELKWEIRDKLDQANITERVLFPGLGGLSRWLKRHYSPKA
jgi:hypothetical protein